MQNNLNDLINQQKKYQYANLTDKQFAKLIGNPEPGDKVKIHWRGRDLKGIIDDGYLFAIPSCDNSIEEDLFIHIKNPENPGGKDQAEEEWIHLVKLLKYKYVKSIEVINK